MSLGPAASPVNRKHEEAAIEFLERRHAAGTGTVSRSGRADLFETLIPESSTPSGAASTGATSSRNRGDTTSWFPATEKDPQSTHSPPQGHHHETATSTTLATTSNTKKAAPATSKATSKQPAQVLKMTPGRGQSGVVKLQTPASAPKAFAPASTPVPKTAPSSAKGKEDPYEGKGPAEAGRGDQGTPSEGSGQGEWGAPSQP